MAWSIGDRLKHAWNAFTNEAIDWTRSYDYGPSSSRRPDQTKLQWSNERSILASIYNRIALDVASVQIRHVRLDDNERYSETIQSGLNNCLTLDPNIDQDARAFMQDFVLTLFDDGVAAIVPVDTSISPEVSGGYDINSMRVGRVVQWFPRHVRVSVYDDRPFDPENPAGSGGVRREVTLSKKSVVLVQNPMFMVMNEQQSNLQRLKRKLNLLDVIDEQSGSGKLDIIIQLPYLIRSDRKREEANRRRKDLEEQLQGSKYGVGYVDGTERVTQLNRPAENNLLEQVKYLTTLVYGELGLTEEVFQGTADEPTMLNYYNRTIEPILTAIKLEMKRKFLTSTARTQKQSIEFFRDPFKLVPVKDLAEIADKFTRNEILSSNEVRGVIGFKPSSEKGADQLRNKNLPEPVPPTAKALPPAPPADQPQLPPAPQVPPTNQASKGVSQNGSS